MPVRIVEWQLPYTAWDGIEITTDKVIKLLLRDENNLIQINDDNEVYVDLQLADWILPTDEFPVWVTVGRVNSSDGWYQSWTMLNFKTTSWDYGRWIYGTDNHIYYDTWSWIWQQIYTWPEVDALFQQLRSELATVAFTWDYNDLINRPTIPVVWDGILTITQNWTSMWTFSANQQWASTVALTDTTYPSMTAWELGTGTDTTQRTVSAKVIADYVWWKVANAYIYKGSVADYAHLPSSNLTAWDVYNVVAEHTTSPKFVAWSNVAWNGSSRDVLGWEFNIIDNLTSTSTTDALSANQWRILQGQIDDLSALWKFLSLRDATTWLPISFPMATPYSYSTWDYFVVETVSSATPPVNYRPVGSSYDGTASSTAETDELEVWDVYIYDGSVWLLQSNHWKSVTFANIAWQPTDNTNLATALGNKQDTLVSGTNIKTINSQSILWNGDLSITIPTYSTATSTTAWLIKLGSDTAQTIAAETVSSTANRTYAVQLNSSSQAVVNVPRTDHTYTVNNATISFTQWWSAMWDFTTNQWTAETIALQWNLLVTQNAYDALPSSKNTDWNFYFIYSA